MVVKHDPVLISAHRCGAGGDRALENTRTALDRALAAGVDFIEFDVQRCGDGTLVLFHDNWLWADGRRREIADLSFSEFAAQHPTFLKYDEVLPALAGRARAHIDLKFTSPSTAYSEPASTYEVAAVALAVGVLGPHNVIVTTGDDHAVRAIRDWADDLGIELLVGLSLGRRVAGLPLHTQLISAWPASPGSEACPCSCGPSTRRAPCATGCAQAAPGS